MKKRRPKRSVFSERAWIGIYYSEKKEEEQKLDVILKVMERHWIKIIALISQTFSLLQTIQEMKWGPARTETPICKTKIMIRFGTPGIVNYKSINVSTVCEHSFEHQRVFMPIIMKLPSNIDWIPLSYWKLSIMWIMLFVVNVMWNIPTIPC